MAGPRAKGQEVQIRLIRNNAPTTTFEALVSFEDTSLLEVISQGYLGEKTERKDSIYKGHDFSGELHMESQAFFELKTQLEDKAKRRAGAAARVDIAFVIELPTGVNYLRTLLDCEFGPLKTGVGSREDYVTGSFEGSCSETTDQELAA